MSAAATAASGRESFRRFAAIARLDAAYLLRRPPFWIWLSLLVLMSLIVITTGTDFMSAGDSAAGGVRTVVTSQLAIAQVSVIASVLFSTFFASILAGLSPIRDDETGVGSLLHATPLRVGEYVWGKFAGIGLVTGAVTLLNLVVMILLYHVVPIQAANEWRGAFHLSSYLIPTLVLTLPYLLFLTAFSYAVGSAFRQPILIFVLPFALLVCYTVFSGGKPNHMHLVSEHIQMLLDPTGIQWLKRTFFENDRGVDFYNSNAIAFPLDFVLSRVGISLASLLVVFLGQLRLTRELRNVRMRRRKSNEAVEAIPATVAPPPRRNYADTRARLADLHMIGGTPAVFATAWAVMRAELTALMRQPGLYLFLPLIVLISVTSADAEEGMFSARRILTPGYLAAAQMTIVVIFTALLLLAYTVETMERDEACGLTIIRNSLPVRTVSLLLGKFGALCVVGALPLIVSSLFLLIDVAVQPFAVPNSLAPFFLLWGVILGPSLAFWIALVMAIYAMTGHNRYATYSFGALALLLLMGPAKVLTWVGNVFLLDALRWSDLAPMELDGDAVKLSRVMVLAATLFWGLLTLIAFRRRAPDPTRRIGRLRWGIQFRTLAPLLVPAVLYGIPAVTLLNRIAQGQEGIGAEESAKDYWRRNVATWKDAPVPGITNLDMSLDLYPERRAYTGHGELTLINFHAFPLTAIPITPNTAWKNVHWTLDGKSYTPEDRAGLLVFTPNDDALAPGKTLRIGFSYDSPDPGPTANGGGADMEFILPSAVVLTSFSNNMVPEIGYDAEIGVSESNRFDAPDQTVTLAPRERGLPLFGSATPFGLNLTVTAPAGFTVSSVGQCLRQTTSGGRLRQFWQANLDPQAPIRDFNIVAGRNLIERRGQNGTIVRYFPAHTYNVDEMLSALDAARTNYGAWFAPYPWKELKLTEFPDYAGYAQSFATNISFGEGMGFLTSGRNEEGDKTATDAFAIAAHESAHQWWGNMVLPGEGAGSNILSEGLAHFSATLLIEKVKGVDARRQFLREIEYEYNKSRSADSELPLSRMTSDKKGDTAVTYDKGGWVFTMLSEQVMGRDRMLQGLRAYVAKYRASSCHPKISDLLDTLRPFAPDPQAFDAFTDQWFDHVVLPEYKITNAGMVPTPGGKWSVTCKIKNIGSGHVTMYVYALDSRNNRVPMTPVSATGPDTKQVSLTCTLTSRPTKILVDPDVTILQRGRDAADYTFH